MPVSWTVHITEHSLGLPCSWFSHVKWQEPDPQRPGLPVPSLLLLAELGAMVTALQKRPAESTKTTVRAHLVTRAQQPCNPGRQKGSEGAPSSHRARGDSDGGRAFWKTLKPCGSPYLKLWRPHPISPIPGLPLKASCSSRASPRAQRLQRGVTGGLLCRQGLPCSERACTQVSV